MSSSTGLPSPASAAAWRSSIDDDGADDFAEELFLVGEVEVDGALRDTGAACDVVEPRAGEAAFAEDLEGGVEDLLGALFGEAAPARTGAPWGSVAWGAGGGV